jgi:hypothetical protein
MNDVTLIALLGRRDYPTDGVEDYCMPCVGFGRRQGHGRDDGCLCNTRLYHGRDEAFLSVSCPHSKSSEGGSADWGSFTTMQEGIPDIVLLIASDARFNIKSCASLANGQTEPSPPCLWSPWIGCLSRRGKRFPSSLSVRTSQKGRGKRDGAGKRRLSPFSGSREGKTFPKRLPTSLLRPTRQRSD